MFQEQINRSPDLKRLQDEYYRIEVKGGYLIIHQIPYLNSKQEIKWGTLVSQLDLINDKATYNGNHVIMFSGEYPCNKDGSIITGIQHSTVNSTLDMGITVNYTFSNKPEGNYKDYYHKVTRYIEIISAPAKSLNGNISEKACTVIPGESDSSVFQYIDTNSSKANINLINAKFNNQKIAIIGLGGTGSYILDLVAKTPVQEIHLFDGDSLFQHNAFRMPGAVSAEQLERRLRKVTYLAEIYTRMHKNILPHEYYVDEENVTELNQMDYVFICVDKNTVRKTIISHLLKVGVTFIDVGLGVNVVDDSLIGTLRVTTGTALKNDHLQSRISSADSEEDEYATNIQIADLNALNAALAVIKWKKMSGFYHDLIKEHHSTYTIDASNLSDEDHTA